MTAPSSIDPAHFLHEQLAQASPDLLRQMLTTFINTLMSAEADAVCGAEYGARTAERVNTRNGYRVREFDTRAGTLDLSIPKLRAGSYFPDWLLEPASARQASADHRGGDLLSAGGQNPGDAEAGGVPRDHPAEQVPGQRDGARPRRAGRRVPPPAPRPWALHVCGRRRPGAQGPRGRPGGGREIGRASWRERV